jgi:two-component system OmpR family response regulator
VRSFGGGLGEDGEDVQVIWWPEDAESRGAGPTMTPCLLLVAADADPPAELGPLEDWLRLPLDPAELARRRDALLRRSAIGWPLTLDEDGLVRRGTDWVALPTRELALFRSLLENIGRVVSRAELLRSARSHGVAIDPRLLARPVQRLRERLRPLGLEIQTIRGAGYLLHTT